MSDDNKQHTGRVARAAGGPELTLFERLKTAREEAGFSIREAAKLADIGVTTLQNYESARTLPGAGELRRLCKLYTVSANHLVFGGEYPAELHDCDPPAASSFFDTDDENKYIALVGCSLLALPATDREALHQVIAALLSAKVGQEQMQHIDTAAWQWLHKLTVDASIEVFPTVGLPEEQE